MINPRPGGIFINPPVRVQIKAAFMTTGMDVPFAKVRPLIKFLREPELHAPPCGHF